MILRPVRPASPCGPPITKHPEGWMWYTVPSSRYLAGTTCCKIQTRKICRHLHDCNFSRPSIIQHVSASLTSLGYNMTKSVCIYLDMVEIHSEHARLLLLFIRLADYGKHLVQTVVLLGLSLQNFIQLTNLVPQVHKLSS